MHESHSWAHIDLDALRHNFERARISAPGRRVCAVIKANAYGHGVHTVARALQAALHPNDLFAVATLIEALTLRRTVSKEAILVLRGPLTVEELALLIQGGFHWVMHSRWQADLLKQWLKQFTSIKPPVLNIWLKINTGMNRLGLPADDLRDVWQWLQSLTLPGERVLMSHFATADEHEHVLANQQQAQFARLVKTLPHAEHCSRSLSASAGIVSWPQAHHDIVRPGIMLYGASPMADTDGSH
ncbi:MAG: alanine racemase, partial [Pseudohongiella sp.]|nr:alanine racemase [Pseudohongiella sp.]